MNLKTLAAATALAACFLAATARAVDLAAVTEALVHESADGAKLPYRQYLPRDLPEGTKIPLLLFLHGAGERGDDNARQLCNGVEKIVAFADARGIPFAMLVPQCPGPNQWVDTPWSQLSHRMDPEPSMPMRLAMELLEAKIAELPVDPSRIYVTGLSMGGYGTWDILQRRPGRFAAAIPICGGGDTTLAWRIRDVPIWAFHGAADSTVPVSRSRDMVAALWACDGNIRYREYPGVGHGSWGPTYQDESVLEWLFRQHR
ncbi:MAG: prolyl oligopeptidase family serine peptidase [Kiritimatiellia bacterium]